MSAATLPDGRVITTATYHLLDSAGNVLAAIPMTEREANLRNRIISERGVWRGMAPVDVAGWVKAEGKAA